MNSVVAARVAVLAGGLSGDIDWPPTLLLLLVFAVVLLLVGGSIAVMLTPYLQQMRLLPPPPEQTVLDKLSSWLRVGRDDVPNRVAWLMDQNRAAEIEIDRLKRSTAARPSGHATAAGPPVADHTVSAQREALIAGVLKVKGLVDDDITADVLDEAMRRGGVTTFEATGMRLDPSRHRVDHTVAAPGPDSDGIVAQTLEPGYEDRDLVLQPARVVVYKWPTR